MRSLVPSLCLLLSTVGFASPSAPAVPLPQESRADVFDVELQRIHSKLEQGEWARAERQLQAILGSHAQQPYVVEHLGEIELILKRCRFWPDHEDVDVGALLRGELVTFDRKRGHLKLRYSSPGQMDYQPSNTSNVRPFAIPFSGPYSVELKGEEEAFLAVCLDKDSAITVQFGYEPPAKPYGFKPDKNVEIQRWVEITTISFDRRGKRKEDTQRKEFTTRGQGTEPRLRVEVGTRQVSARFEGKSVLAVRRPADVYGGLGFHPTAPHSDQVEIEGDASGWIQAQRDRQASGPMKEFNRNWNLAEHVPDWLIQMAREPSGLPAAPRSAPSGPTTQPMARASESERQAYTDAAAGQLYSGNPQQCLALIADGIRKGVPAAALQGLSSTANKALHGPSWTSKHTFESANYVVSSDVSRDVSRQVAQVLEESLQHVSLRMGYAPDTRSRKFTVYVFSGERSYNLFVEDVFGARLENTLGMYSGALKQLLIRYTDSLDDSLNTARHEGFHQYLDAFPIQQPIWLNEGLAEYFAAARSKGSAWHDGALDEGRLAVLHQLMKMEGGLEARLFPLKRFVALQPAEFMGNAQIAYAEAWAFVHFLRHSSVHHRDSFKRLFAELMAGNTAEQAISRAFAGTDWKGLDAEFRRYIEGL